MDKRRRRELEGIIAAARKELDAADTAAAQAKNRGAVGKCFRYHNSFGSGERWWLYVKVIGLDGNGLRLLTFQEDLTGRIEIKPNEYVYSLVNYESIPEAEFDAAWSALMERISRIE